MKEIKLPMKKSFLEFMSLFEAVYDKDMAGGAAIKKIDREGRVNPVVRRKEREENKVGRKDKNLE